MALMFSSWLENGHRFPDRSARFVIWGTLFGLIVCGSIGCAPSKPQPLTVAERQLVERLLVKGTLLMRHGTSEALEQAEAEFNLARELAPADARPVDGLGCVAWRRGAIDSAERYFVLALELDPQYARGHSHLALVQEQRGRTAKAAALHSTALALDPVDYQVRNNRAALAIEQAHDSTGRANAVLEFRKAHALGGRDQGIIVENLERFGIDP